MRCREDVNTRANGRPSNVWQARAVRASFVQRPTRPAESGEPFDSFNVNRATAEKV